MNLSDLIAMFSNIPRYKQQIVVFALSVFFIFTLGGVACSDCTEDLHFDYFVGIYNWCILFLVRTITSTREAALAFISTVLTLVPSLLAIAFSLLIAAFLLYAALPILVNAGFSYTIAGCFNG